MEQLRRMIGTLREDTVVQPFSSMDFYSFGKTLGQGAYGKVKLGAHLLTGEKVAVKTFEKSKLTEAHARKRVSREIRILKALSHPNIIKLYEVVDVPLRKYLIMQYSSGGDLCRYVRSAAAAADAADVRVAAPIRRAWKGSVLQGEGVRGGPGAGREGCGAGDGGGGRSEACGSSGLAGSSRGFREACSYPEAAPPRSARSRPAEPVPRVYL